MIWGENPLFLETPISSSYLCSPRTHEREIPKLQVPQPTQRETRAQSWTFRKRNHEKFSHKVRSSFKDYFSRVSPICFQDCKHEKPSKKTPCFSIALCLFHAFCVPKTHRIQKNVLHLFFLSCGHQRHEFMSRAHDQGKGGASNTTTTSQ